MGSTVRTSKQHRVPQSAVLCSRQFGSDKSETSHGAFIIMDCVSRMGVPVNGQDHNITDIMMSQGSNDLRIRWWWETVDAVEIILLLTENSRSKVLGVLSATLIRGTLSGTMLAGESLAEIENEVRLVWSSRRCNTSS